ncbi:MAG TPA: hypothetical protein VF992_12120 [Thermoplasmata archaeon]
MRSGRGVFTHPWIAALAAFSVPALLRSVPEVLAGSMPVGFDTISLYIPFQVSCAREGLTTCLGRVVDSRSGPLLFAVLALTSAVGSPPLVVGKLLGPVVSGVFGLSLLGFARRRLRWSPAGGIALAVLAFLTLPVLRLAWDLFRNVLGLAFLMISLALAEEKATVRSEGASLACLALAALSHELVAFLIAASLAVEIVVKPLQVRASLASFVPRAAIAASAVLYYLSVGAEVHGILVASQAQDPNASLWADYLTPGGLYSYPDYVTLTAHVAVTAGVLLAVFVFPVWKRGVVAPKLLPLGASLGLVSISPLLIPTFAVPLWHRWLLMAAVPLLPSLAAFVTSQTWRHRAASIGVLCAIVLPFLVLPANVAAPYLSTPLTTRYIPSSMVQNSIPISDCEDVLAALGWLRASPLNGSLFVVHAAFAGWAYLVLDRTTIRAVWTVDEFQSIRAREGPAIATIWWARPDGWYPDFAPPSDLHVAWQQGNIAIYSA